MKGWDSVGTKNDVHTFKFVFFLWGSEGKFKLKLNWPFPIEAAGILLNETPSLHDSWFVAYSFFFVSSPCGVVPEDDDVLWWSVFLVVIGKMRESANYLLVALMSPSVDMDLGRSMGRPRARSQTSEANTPRARETPNSTV